MKIQAAELARRINAALASGKLKADGKYTIATLCVAISTTRGAFSEAVNREYGSIVGFCQKIGFAGLKS